MSQFWTIGLSILTGAFIGRMWVLQERMLKALLNREVCPECGAKKRTVRVIRAPAPEDNGPEIPYVQGTTP